MIGVVGANYLGKGASPVPFSALSPPPMGHPLSRMMLVAPTPPSAVEWVWNTMPMMGMVNTPALVFGPLRWQS